LTIRVKGKLIDFSFAIGAGLFGAKFGTSAIYRGDVGTLAFIAIQK
jgi:hypothetical protein